MIEPLKWHEDKTSKRIEPSEILGKLNELTDAVNDLEATVYGCDEDCDDLCPDCWAETQPFIDNLRDLSDVQLLGLRERVACILDEREEGDDGYCEQCNDYHDLPDDDDDDDEITWEIQDVVDDVRHERKKYAQRLEDGLREIKEGRDAAKKGGDHKSVDTANDDEGGGERWYTSTLKKTPLFNKVDTSDGLFADFTAYVARNPEQRFFQAIRNFSGYNFIFGSMSKNADDYSQLEDTFNLKTKGPKKGAQPVHGNT